MGWNNVLLNINGRTDKQLLDTLKLVFSLQDYKGVKGFIKDREKGLILLWYSLADKEAQEFPVPLSAEEVFPAVVAYLKSEEAKEVDLADWEEDYDHDGSNSVGWRVYAEDWGHVKTHYSICAIKRVFLWHGK